MARMMLCRLSTNDRLLSATELQLGALQFIDKQSAMVRELCEALGYASHAGIFCSTSCGRISLGPLKAQCGDLIYIFYNGYTILSCGLRKSSDSDTPDIVYHLLVHDYVSVVFTETMEDRGDISIVTCRDYRVEHSASSGQEFSHLHLCIRRDNHGRSIREETGI